MKNNYKFAIVLAVVCFLWGFAVRGASGPFCSLCNLVTVSTINEDEYNATVASVNLRLDYIYSVDLTGFGQAINGMLDAANAMRDAIAPYESVIDPAAYSAMMFQLQNAQAAYDSTAFYWYDALQCIDDIRGSLNSVVISHDQYCESCSATGSGSGDCTCTCSCPDYSSILTEISSRILSLKDNDDTIKNNIVALRTAFDSFFVKWQTQDEKLTPLIEELKPMLTNIKKFYDDYYNAGWGSETWQNIKNVISDITEKEIVKKWDRYYGDYQSSGFSSDSWNSFAYAMASAERIAKSDVGFGKTGEDSSIAILKDYYESFKEPLGTSYTVPSEVPDEKEYMRLNFFQRITCALGLLAFPDTNVTGRVDVDWDKEKNAADGVQNIVGNLSSDVGNKMGSLYNSYKGIFDSFKGIVPADQLPTSIRLHPGFKFEYPNPQGGENPYVLPPWDWNLGEFPILKTALDMIRGIFGFVWWVLGFGIIYEICVGVYHFVLVLTQKAMAVFGSLGRSGGGAE